MKKTFYLLILTLFFSHHCKADTIDFWHVFYNKVKLKEFDQNNGGGTITIKAGKIKTGDRIVVKYFRDTPCFDCVTILTTEDVKHHVVTTNYGKGTFTPVSFSLTDILKFKKQSGNDYFEIYLFEENGRTKKTLLFRVKLE